MNSKKWTEVSFDIFSKFWRVQIEGEIQNGRQNVTKYHKITFDHTLDNEDEMFFLVKIPVLYTKTVRSNII